QRANRRAAGAGLLDRSDGDLTSDQVFAIRNIQVAQAIGALTDFSRAPKHLLVFVHGYRVGFEDALKRAAQVAFDLDFDGPSFVFAWPSQAKLLAYDEDLLNAQLSVGQFAAFLGALTASVPSTKVHVVPHSMGNVVMLGALEKLGEDPAKRHGVMGEIIMAHPDIALDQFK